MNWKTCAISVKQLLQQPQRIIGNGEFLEQSHGTKPQKVKQEEKQQEEQILTSKHTTTKSEDLLPESQNFAKNRRATTTLAQAKKEEVLDQFKQANKHLKRKVILTQPDLPTNSGVADNRRKRSKLTLTQLVNEHKRLHHKKKQRTK